MANFERLIKGALASQDASSAEVRQVIYQSSRNALQKIIDNNRSLTLEAVMEQKRQLEVSITSIEAEYNPPAPTSEPIMEQIVELQPEPVVEVPTFEEPIVVENTPEEFITPPMTDDVASPVETVPEVDPLYEIQQILEITTSTTVQPEPEHSASVEQIVDPIIEPAPVALQPESVAELAQDDFSVQTPEFTGEATPQPEPYYQEQENIPLGFSKRRKMQKRFLWTIITLLILGLLAWITYIVVMGFLDGSLLGQKDTKGPKLNPNSISRQADSENYITVIEPSDLSSLVMSGRGKAQIVRELNSDMIRINSVRDALNRSEPALPILVRLKPGVLKQISGKRVTVEIFAKSGGGESAHFAVGCEFGDLTECGRKRFLAGSQPNASVFAFQMDKVGDINQDMFLTLSTDTTSQAAVTGKGDVLDIVYIRLSVDG